MAAGGVPASAPSHHTPPPPPTPRPSSHAGQRAEDGHAVLPDLGVLNTDQRAAVQVAGGALVIVAGPGSGKTRVITHRVAWLLSAQRVAARSIAVVTFTNKVVVLPGSLARCSRQTPPPRPSPHCNAPLPPQAAAEVKERVMALAPQAKALRMGTFHSLAARFLRQHGSRIGLDPSFVIADGRASQRMAGELLARHDARADLTKHAVLKWISDRKNTMQTPEQALAQGKHGGSGGGGGNAGRPHPHLRFGLDGTGPLFPPPDAITHRSACLSSASLAGLLRSSIVTTRPCCSSSTCLTLTTCC